MEYPNFNKDLEKDYFLTKGSATDGKTSKMIWIGVRRICTRAWNCRTLTFQGCKAENIIQRYSLLDIAERCGYKLEIKVKKSRGNKIFFIVHSYLTSKFILISVESKNYQNKSGGNMGHETIVDKNYI